MSLDPLDPLVGELIDLVNSYSDRWESLDISYQPKLLLLLSKSMTILKAITFFSSGYFYPLYVWFLGIHGNNITHFTAQYIDVGQALEILRLSPQLQECSLIDLREYDDDIPLPSSVLISEPVLDDLLNNINVSSLKSFKYDGNGYILSCDGIFAFLNRSGCLLNTFSLKHANIAEEEIIRLLFAMPYLETLSLGPPSADSLKCARWNFGVPFVTDRMLGILADTAEISACLDDRRDRPFLPNLQSLKYTGCATFSRECIPFIFGDRRVKEPGVSEAPITNLRPLHSLTMELYPYGSDLDLYPNVISELKHLRTEEGYEIQILDVIGDVPRDLAT